VRWNAFFPTWHEWCQVLVSSRVVVKHTQKGDFYKNTRICGKKCLFIYLKNVFQGQGSRYKLPYLEIYLKIDLVHFMVSSYYILYLKAGLYSPRGGP
jgi:hypothetical protein